MAAQPSSKSRLLITNDAPNALEAAFAQEEATNLEIQIRELEARLRGCRAILHPLRRVPSEILALILTFAVQDSLGYYTDKGRLLDLCLVCKDWYQAALTAQQVWGRLEIKPFSTSSPNWDVLYRWLRRANSGSRALKISQGSVCRHMFEHTVRCVMKNESLVKLLVDGPSAHSMTLETTSSECLENLFASMQSFHRQLHTESDSSAWQSVSRLQLSVTGDYLGAWLAPSTLAQSILAYLPRSLTSLHLRIPDESLVERIESDTWETDPPWLSLHIPPAILENLTSLSIECNWNGPYLVLALQHCTNLQELSIDFRQADACTSGPHSPPGWAGPSHVFVDETHTDYDPHEEAGYAVTSFVRTLESRLPFWRDKMKSLTLEIPHGSRIETIDSQQLVDLASYLPSLTHLLLDHFTFELQAFVDASPRSYFPSLEHLELRNIPGDFDLASLLECLDDWRRNGDLDSLKRVSITYARHGYTAETDKVRMKLVQKLREMGVKVDGEVEVANKALYFWPSSAPLATPIPSSRLPPFTCGADSASSDRCREFSQDRHDMSSSNSNAVETGIPSRRRTERNGSQTGSFHTTYDSRSEDLSREEVASEDGAAMSSDCPSNVLVRNQNMYENSQHNQFHHHYGDIHHITKNYNGSGKDDLQRARESQYSLFAHHVSGAVDECVAAELESKISRGAAHDSAERGPHAPKCDKGTREAVQREILSWIDCGGQRMLWLYGPAGAGKSAIAGSIADECQRRKWLAGSFFFSDFAGRPDRYLKQYLFPTLAYHLIQLDIAGLREAVLSAIDTFPSVFDKRLDEQLRILILEPLQKIRQATIQSCTFKTIIVDGVDECKEDAGKEGDTEQDLQRRIE
ncbi:hypothetical protein NMY22_g6572 [Coprinellus aureogranulatus]|nr:hypothetical protein NMY22_g6572 [Coprinellus aureogranulatus]